jgi:hypothetical protein
MLGVLDMYEIECRNFKGDTIMRPHFSLADGIDPTALRSPDLAVGGITTTLLLGGVG